MLLLLRSPLRYRLALFAPFLREYRIARALDFPTAAEVLFALAHDAGRLGQDEIGRDG